MKLMILVICLMLSAMNIATDDVHMHLHFENLSKERKLAISKMIKYDLAHHKGVKATFCKFKCLFKSKKQKQKCKADCDRKHNAIQRNLNQQEQNHVSEFNN